MYQRTFIVLLVNVFELYSLYVHQCMPTKFIQTLIFLPFLSLASSIIIMSDFPLNLLNNEASPEWLNKADNAWELTAAAMVGLQSVPGLIILYGSMVKKKWAVNSAFMALYAFAAVLICWVLFAHHMAFGKGITPIVGKLDEAMTEKQLQSQARSGYLPTADYVFYQFAFAAITVILLGGSLLGRMNFYAWMLFVPLWLTFSYTVGAFTIWGNGFLDGGGIIDFSGGYVIHLSSGVAGFTAAYWVIISHLYIVCFFFSCGG